MIVVVGPLDTATASLADLPAAGWADVIAPTITQRRSARGRAPRRGRATAEVDPAHPP